jgi:hypothetical protein
MALGSSRQHKHIFGVPPLRSTWWWLLGVKTYATNGHHSVLNDMPKVTQMMLC